MRVLPAAAAAAAATALVIGLVCIEPALPLRQGFVAFLKRLWRGEDALLRHAKEVVAIVRGNVEVLERELTATVSNARGCTLPVFKQRLAPISWNLEKSLEDLDAIRLQDDNDESLSVKAERRCLISKISALLATLDVEVESKARKAGTEE